MNENLNNVEVIEEETGMSVEVVETEGLIPKIKKVFSKCGKKIAVGAAIGLAGVLGFAIGRNTGGECNDEIEVYVDDLDIADESVETE